MPIYLDFDSTVIIGPFPAINDPVPGAIEGVKLLIEKGHHIVLNTARVHFGQQRIVEVKMFLASHGINVPAYTPHKMEPDAYNPSFVKSMMSNPFGQSMKIYIDDIAKGIPLININGIDCVDWTRVMKDFKEIGIV